MRQRPLRQGVAAGGVLVLLIALALDVPTLVLLALVMSTGAVLSRLLAWDLAVPGAALALLAAAVVAGSAAGGLGVDLLAAPAALSAIFLSWTALAVVLTGSSRPAACGVPAVTSRWRHLLHLPSGLAAVAGLLQAGDSRVAGSWALQGTDLVQHMIGLKAVQAAGALDYAQNAYPAGFYMLAGLTAAPGAPEDPASLVVYDMQVVASASWLAVAAVLCAGVGVAVRLAEAARLSEARVVGSGLLVGGGLLLANPFLDVFVYMGAVPSLLAVLALWMVPLAALASQRVRQSVSVVTAVAAVAAMLLAHLWQALVLVPVVALLCFLVATLLWARERLVPARRPAAAAGVVVLLATAVALPPLLGVLDAGGAGLAAIPGELPPAPLVLLVLGLLALVAAGWRCRTGWVHALLGTGVGLLLVTGVLLRGAGQGLDLEQYYPTKALWFLAVFLAPVVAIVLVVGLSAAAARVWRLLGRLGPARRLARFAVCASSCAAAGALGLPHLVAQPSAAVGSVRAVWAEPSSSSATLLGIAREHAVKYEPAVTVPVAVGTSAVLDRHGSYMVSKLISIQTGQPQNHGNPRFVCGDVAAVAGEKPAVVITKLDPFLLRQIMRRSGCADVPIVRVPGDLRDVDFLAGTLDGR